MRGRGRLGGILAVGAALACGCFFYALTRSPLFCGGSYVFAQGTSSAALEESACPALYKLFTPVAGESACYAGDVHEALLARFSARVLFTEEACGVRSYYCFSPFLRGGAVLNGQRVNLHIAVGRGMTAAGSPVIFGGF